MSHPIRLVGGGIFHITERDFHLYICRDDELRRKSSSGGAFTAFAEAVLEADGIVYASRYNFAEERLEVADSDRYPLSEFRKSKYIESNTLHAFTEIKEWLGKGRQVLFCGTPCQVSGLKCFLGKTPQTELVTIDFFCHGVPANGHFTAFKHQLEGKARKMTGFDFRHKRPGDGTGWHDLVFKAEFDDGTSVTHPYEPPYYYLYYKPFEDSLVLRRSCYDCHAVESSRADITLGDFWGVRRFAPDIDDNRGISVVKLHTPRAKELWQHVNATGTTSEIPYRSVANNYNRTHPVHLLPRRDRLAACIAKKGFAAAMSRYYRRERLIRAAKRRIKKLLGRSK